MARAQAILCVILVASSALALAAAAPRYGDLEISRVWSRPTVPGQTDGVVYLTVKNEGKVVDALLSASTPAAGSAEIHTMKMSGGMMMMRAVASLPVPPGGELALEPGGDHIMLLGLKAPLKRGDTIAVTLTFEHQGKVDIAVPVLDAEP